MTHPSERPIRLDDDELAVLFDLLGRWIEDGHVPKVRALTEHEAEIWALNNLFCAIEREIVPGVPGGLAGARARLVERCGGLFPG